MIEQQPSKDKKSGPAHPLFNLQDYEDTGQTVDILAEISLKYAKSTEAYQFLNFLNKPENFTPFFNQAIILQRPHSNNDPDCLTLVLNDHSTIAELQYKQVPQEIVHPHRLLINQVLQLNVDVKDQNVSQYIATHTKFYQSNPRNNSKSKNSLTKNQVNHVQSNNNHSQPESAQVQISRTTNAGGQNMNVRELISNLKEKEVRMRQRRKRRYELLLRRARRINEDKIKRRAIEQGEAGESHSEAESQKRGESEEQIYQESDN